MSFSPYGRDEGAAWLIVQEEAYNEQRKDKSSPDNLFYFQFRKDEYDQLLAT
jgi:hypothetical protein